MYILYIYIYIYVCIFIFKTCPNLEFLQHAACPTAYSVATQKAQQTHKKTAKNDTKPSNCHLLVSFCGPWGHKWHQNPEKCRPRPPNNHQNDPKVFPTSIFYNS